MLTEIKRLHASGRRHGIGGDEVSFQEVRRLLRPVAAASSTGRKKGQAWGSARDKVETSASLSNAEDTACDEMRIPASSESMDVLLMTARLVMQRPPANAGVYRTRIGPGIAIIIIILVCRMIVLQYEIIMGGHGTPWRRPVDFTYDNYCIYSYESLPPEAHREPPLFCHLYIFSHIGAIT